MIITIFAVSAVLFALLALGNIPEILGLSWSDLRALAIILFLVWGVLPGGETVLLIILAVLLVILLIVAIQRKPAPK